MGERRRRLGKGAVLAWACVHVCGGGIHLLCGEGGRCGRCGRRGQVGGW